MLSPLGQSGLEAKILALVTPSELWPRPQTFGLGVALACSRRTNSPEVCLLTTGHHTMIHVEGNYCDRENERLKCVILIITI